MIITHIKKLTITFIRNSHTDIEDFRIYNSKNELPINKYMLIFLPAAS